MRAFALLLLATPAMAQDLTTADCVAIVAAAQPAMTSLQIPFTLPAPTATDGWCVIGPTTVEPAGDYQPAYSFAALQFRGAGLAAFPAGQPPTTLDIQLRDLRVTPRTTDARLDYLLGLQGARSGIFVDIAAQYDPATRVLKLDRFDIDLPGNNAIGMTAQIDRLDLTSTSGLQMSVGTAGLTSLGLTATSNGLFETYLVLPLGNALLPEIPETIDHAFYTASIIADTRATIASLPDTLIDAPSRGALDAVLAEMPHPWGKLTLQMQAPAGFGTQRFMGFAVTGVPYTLQDWLPVFAGVTITATYTPSPKEH
jgi:hypothetical protein